MAKTDKVKAKLYSWHYYDIVTSFLYHDMIKVLHDNSIPKPKNFNETEYRQIIDIMIKGYCNYNNIEFVSVLATQLNIPSTSGFYSEFLSYSLAYRDVPQLKLFLDYQKKHYQGTHEFPKADFVSLVEFICSRHVSNICFYEKKERLTIMMEWVREMRQKYPKLPNETIRQLKWQGELSHLKLLSKELKIRDYIERITDFEKVFTSQTPCKWLKEVESLAYLIDNLHSTGHLLSIPRPNAYFASAQAYFYDNSKNVETVGTEARKLNLRDALYNLRSRNPEKYSKIKSSIDKILSTVFKVSQ